MGYHDDQGLCSDSPSRTGITHPAHRERQNFKRKFPLLQLARFAAHSRNLEVDVKDTLYSPLGPRVVGMAVHVRSTSSPRGRAAGSPAGDIDKQALAQATGTSVK